MNKICLSEENFNTLLKYALNSCSKKEVSQNLNKNHTNFLNFMVNPVSDTSTKVCYPGFYRSEYECLPCQPGSYSSDLDAFECKKCPEGYYCPKRGTSSPIPCPKYKDHEGNSYYCPSGSICPKCTEIDYCNPPC